MGNRQRMAMTGKRSRNRLVMKMVMKRVRIPMTPVGICIRIASNDEKPHYQHGESTMMR